MILLLYYPSYQLLLQHQLIPKLSFPSHQNDHIHKPSTLSLTLKMLIILLLLPLFLLSMHSFPLQLPQVTLNHVFLLGELFLITTGFLQLNPCKLKKLHHDQFALANPTLGLFTRLSFFHLLIINS